MSYGLALAGDAGSDLRGLEPWLQEEVLDELEGIAHDPSILPDAAPGNNVTYRFKRTAAGTSHFLTLALWRNDGSRLLTVLGITRRTVLPPP